MFDREDLYELYKIHCDRIEEISRELSFDDPYAAYFKSVSACMQLTIKIFDMHDDGSFRGLSTEDKKALIEEIYSEQTDGYESSFLNPDVAVKSFGLEPGQVLSAIYAELISAVIYAYETDLEALCIRLSLFLELYSACYVSLEAGKEPDTEYLKSIYCEYAYDCTMDMMRHRVRDIYTTDNGIAGRIIASADLKTPDYLYEYGEYITDNETQLVAFLGQMPDNEVRHIADVFCDAYIRGFAATGKDIGIKETVEIRYPVGFERIVKEAVEIFKSRGLNSSLRRFDVSFVSGRTLARNGYYSTIPNRQFEADHEKDKALFFDKRYVEHRLTCYRNALEEYKTQAGVYGGPAVIECFGEKPVYLTQKSTAIRPDEATDKLFAQNAVRAMDILNEYVRGEERSFTIIAFPTPCIGPDFEKIFRETVKLNTLDYKLYQDMQQIMIDTLDKATSVAVRGTDGNETDLRISLWKLEDPDKETIFENCVADVNIPVGEVFTSPVLEGTEGLLHVKQVYLNDMPFKDLKLWIHDGMITDYTCANYESEKDNKDYIKKYLLFSHDTLPMGEFAIGTNTTAYVMSRKYSIQSIMPILIEEKTGPHFAMGDTCYSHEEDVATYNPDGKAIVARQNSISAKRKEDPLGAYFGCHTDITIPYDELGFLKAVTNEGDIDIIVNGRFVLKGTEALNEPLDRLQNGDVYE